jgi:hypothetical protein
MVLARAIFGERTVGFRAEHGVAAVREKEVFLTTHVENAFERFSERMR